MSLTLGLLSALPAHAQATTHCWNITYAYSNVVNNHFQRDVPTMGQKTPTDSQGGSAIIDGDNEETVTATLTWVPAAGQTLQSDPPSEPVHIHESGYAIEESLGSGPGTGTADDGLGDPAVGGSGSQQSQGVHVLQKDGSSGTITLNAVTLKAINPVSTWQSYPNYPGYYYWDWTGGQDAVSFNVAVVNDNRAVIITSPIETSYYKGNSQSGTTDQWVHQRDPITGAISVDSAVAWHDASSGLGGPDYARGWQINNLPLTATPINFLGYPTYSWSLQGLSEGYNGPIN